MADTPHDEFGSSSPKPGDIAPQQASRPDSPDRDKLRVFISYSRDDLRFADQLDMALNACGFECFIDRHGISGGEEWKRRLGNLISEADTVVFVLSPASAQSPVCAWEVKEAAQLGKRILPANCLPLEGVNPPSQLRDLNYIFFYEDPKVPDSGFGSGLAKLIAALNTDFDWLREHTRYLQRAIEWDRGGRPANRLLSGDDIADAKTWVARRPKNAPEPTALHLDFIRASEEEAEARSSAQRKQLEAMAAAQAERQQALDDREEAQKQAADAQSKRARIRNVAFVVVSIFAVLAVLLGLFAEQQRRTAVTSRKVAEEHRAVAEGQRKVAEEQRELAEEQRKVAEERRKVAEEQKEQINRILQGATSIIVRSADKMDADTRKDSFAIFQTGADLGDVQSMHNLGSLYMVEKDSAKAREWLEKAADRGHTVAMWSLGQIYEKGQDYSRAREWYEKAASGAPPAMVALGLLYANGYGVAQDSDKAREWFEKAADWGYEPATWRLGLLYYTSQDYAKAHEWFEKGAEKGSANAMTGLGWLYQKGQGVARDYKKAREWYEKAAEKGSAIAMTGLAGLYQNGQGVAQDYKKAREWYEKAADNDEANAMTSLGELYEAGHGVAKDYAKAREWYQKAADNGDASAMTYLGELYEAGHGVAKDYAKAREWYQKAADNGDASAMTYLKKLSIREAASDRSRARASSGARHR